MHNAVNRALIFAYMFKYMEEGEHDQDINPVTEEDDDDDEDDDEDDE